VGVQRPTVAPLQGAGRQVVGFEAGQGPGPVRPVLEQIGQPVDGLGWPGRPGQVLAGLGRLHPGRGPAVGGGEPGGPVLLGAVDLVRPGGELGEQVVADAVDLEGGVAPLPALAHAPRHGQPAGELVGEQHVVQLRHGHHGTVDGRAVQRPPPAVRTLDLVREHDVGVQVRVRGAGVPVLERGGDHPLRADLAAPRRPDPGPHHLGLDELQHAGQGGPMGAVNLGAGRVVAQGPQDRDGLGDRERQVVPDHRMTPRSLWRPGNGVGGLVVARVGAPERCTGQRVHPVREDRGHRLLADQVARDQARDRLGAQPSQPVAVPAARRVAGLLVVPGQRVARTQARVPRRDVAGQVSVAVAGRELVHRHHRSLTSPPRPLARAGCCRDR